MENAPTERELLRQRLHELDAQLDDLSNRPSSPQDRANERIKLSAEYARLVKLLAEMGPDPK